MRDLMPSSTTNPLRPGLWQLVLGLGVLLVLALLPWPLGGPAQAANSFSPGDLVFGLNSSLDGTLEGKLHHYSSDGSTLLNVLYTNSGAFGESGPCFNAARNLFTTNFEGNSMSKFNSDGTLASSGFALGLNEHPNSCIFDAAGNLFVGMSDLNGGFGGGRLLKLDASGQVADTFYTDTEGRGTEWIDLAADQCTMFYTTASSSIKRHYVCDDNPGQPRGQLSDFCTSCSDSMGPFWGLRLLPDGGMIVADMNGMGPGLIRRYNASGMQVTTYTATNSSDPTCGDNGDQPCFFPYSLALDIDGHSFWTVDFLTGEAFKFDLEAAGSPVSSSLSFPGGDCEDFHIFCSITGLAIVGEPRVALPTPDSGSPKPVTASLTAANKTYDGTTAATITGCTLAGVDQEDANDVVCNHPTTGTFDTADVGNGKPVAHGAVTLDLTGSAAGKYVLSSTQSPGANVMPKDASVTPNAAGKTYGAADPALSGTLSGFVAGDGVSATYSRTAGEAAGGSYAISATLSPAGVLGNYNITYNTAAFTIDKANASVTSNAAGKTYGTSDPALSGTLSGFLAGDGVTATYSRTSGEAVGTYTISATLSPAAVMSNYSITYNNAAFTITQANASVTPNAASKSFGAPDPVLTGSLSGFLAADGVTASFTRTAGESVLGGPYIISATLGSSAALGNYNITYNTAPFTITPAMASVTPNPATKVYGTADPVLSGTLSGFLPGSGVTATYSRVAGENVAGGPYAISATLSPSTALGNYTITYNTAAFTITPATPIVTWTDPADITYPTPLSGTQLNATANVSGTFDYSPSAGTILSVGNSQLLSVLLTPTDNSNYTTATAQVHINVLPTDVSVVKTTPTPQINVGETATYNLVVTSNGPGSASNVVLTDVLPVGLDWTVGGADAGACSPIADGTLTCNFGTLAPGATKNITLSAVTTTMACGDAVNTATVSSTADSNSSNNSSAPVTIRVNCPAIGISKMTTTPSVLAGDTVVYKVTVTAGGDYESTNVVMTDVLPAGLVWTVAGYDAEDCSASQLAGGSTLTCDYGTMSPGEKRTITLTAVTTAANCGTISNTATVTDSLDTSPGDNSAGPVNIAVACPDVSVAVTTPWSIVNAGSNAVYQVTVTSNSAASNVTLTNVLPSGLSWTVSGPHGGACLPASPVAGGMTLTCNFGTMTANATRTITLTAATTTANCGVINDSATVSATGDVNSSNNSSGPVPITVVCPVTPPPSNISLSCPNVSLVNNALSVWGTVTNGSNLPVTVQYTSPSGLATSHSTTTNNAGNYTDSMVANEVGDWSVRASTGPVQSSECPVIVYGKSVGGTFVIGDVIPYGQGLGATADFWGSQWWKDNVWSGPVNPGVASLKGYLDAVDLPSACGGSWSTRPGNSSKPPATVPTYLAVVVSSKMEKNGPTISGDVVAIAIVRTSPGYGPAPGHDGYGVITKLKCPVPNPPNP